MVLQQGFHFFPSSTKDKKEQGRSWGRKRGEGGRMMLPPSGGRLQGAAK
jgi:hypothetical protein